MAMVLNEDQLMLQESVRSFCQENATVSVLRRLRDERSAAGFDRDLWAQMVALGWAGMVIPETYGGFGFGYGGLGIVMEETGRTLVPTPLLSTVVLCGSAITLGGSEEQKKLLLPQIASGKLVMALALEETAFHRPTEFNCRVERQGDSFRLEGSKQFVLDGHIADRFIVVASHAQTQTTGLFLVDSQQPEVEVRRRMMVDNRNAADVVFSGVEITADHVLVEPGQADSVLERTLDIGRIALAAEMLGSIQEVFERTIEYLQQREQFGVQIGAFQALQHRAALMYSEIELCRSVVRKALDALDNDAANIALLASIAKAKLSEVAELVTNEGIQMHGGIGMTDEFDLGFYLKRARVAQQSLGDAAFHRDRYARLSGF
ncbi:MAG: acyl-CoA dehydrogenase [Pseudomonadales bacterium]|nr:acyl-CoA dehydrogenase [Pseudomonadales bacterium]